VIFNKLFFNNFFNIHAKVFNKNHEKEKRGILRDIPMKIEDYLFGEFREKPWAVRKKKYHKFFEEKLKESLRNKESELEKQVKKISSTS
tara:strand:+ start:106 stop:372 length:267 start_codon:yes stop_codon:yes gene_type:complete